MPKHFLHIMDLSKPAPAGDGDVESWFRFYKWKVEGETFVPRRDFLKDVAPGDFIWFGFLNSENGHHQPKVFGGSRILRIEEENRIQEIWYRGDDLYELDPVVDWNGGQLEVPLEVAEQWMKSARRISP